MCCLQWYIYYIILCNADKRSSCHTRLKDDIKEPDMKLSDDFYKKLPKDATLLHGELVNNTIEHLKNTILISEKLTINGIRPKNTSLLLITETTQG